MCIGRTHRENLAKNYFRKLGVTMRSISVVGMLKTIWGEEHGI